MISVYWSFQSLSAHFESTDKPIIPFSSLFSFDGVIKSICHLRHKLEDVFKEELITISERVKDLEIHLNIY